MIIPEYKLVFIHIPKCAGTTILNIFIKNDELCEHSKDKGVRYKIKNNSAINDHYFLGSIDLHGSYDAHKREMLKHGINVNEYKWFTVVRNPWDKVVSLYSFYRDKIHTCSDSFENFVRAHKDSFDYEHLVGDNKMDYIIRFENLENELENMFNELGIQCDNIPHKNSMNRRCDYRSFYTRETEAIVRREYSKEIEKFKYTF